MHFKQVSNNTEQNIYCMIVDFLSDFYGKSRPRTKRNKLGYRKPRVKPVPESLIWDINEQEIPVELFREKRTSWRFAFTKDNKLTVRIPIVEAESEAKLLYDVQKRLSDRMKKKPNLNDFFNPKEYLGGDVLIFGAQTYTLSVFIEARKTNTARLTVVKGRKMIEFKLDAYAEPKVRRKDMATLLSRIVSADHLPSFSRRVHELNEKHFGEHAKEIKNISFKYNHSNWGSCSSAGNLNFSSRLLFAPQDVQDYVIIHELAHLIELNHSDAFWQLVANAMPNYTEKENWLKENGTACRF